MIWHYQLDGKAAGPVTEEKLDALFREGRITVDSLVWRDGFEDWRRYAEVRPPASAAAPNSPRGVQCIGCGRSFPPDEVVKLNNASVCAECKPTILQRLAEGLPAGGFGSLWREGKKLVTVSGQTLPDRCVKCNEPANGFRLRRVLYWHHPAIYLLILLTVLLYVIVGIIVRKKAILEIGLCKNHRRQRWIAVAVCWAGVLGGLAIMLAALSFSSRKTALTGGLIVLIGGIIWGLVKGRTVSACRIVKKEVWVKGVCESYLDELPER